jgi:hypothetical protein
MISMDVSVYARGATPDGQQPVRLAGITYQSLPAAAQDRRATFCVTFEEAAERMEKLPRFCLEPDGSFVWVGEGWQLDGQIGEWNGGVASVEVRGTCPAGQFEELLGVFGWPETEVVFEVRRAGVLLEEREFRRLVGWT